MIFFCCWVKPSAGGGEGNGGCSCSSTTSMSESGRERPAGSEPNMTAWQPGTPRVPRSSWFICSTPPQLSETSGCSRDGCSRDGVPLPQRWVLPTYCGHAGACVAHPLGIETQH